FNLIPGVDRTLVKGSLDLEISEADRTNIVTFVEDQVRTLLQDFLLNLVPGLPPVLPGTELEHKFDDFFGRFIDHVVDVLPSWVGADRWKPFLTSVLQQAMPWLN